MVVMEVAAIVMLALVSLGLGALLMQAQKRNAALADARDREREEKNQLAQQLAAERAQSQARLEAQGKAEQQLRATFAELASQALSSNNKTFLDLAKQNLETQQQQAKGELQKLQQQAKGDLDLKEKAVEALVKPIRETLQQVNLHVQDLEKVRAQAYGSLTEQVRALQATTGTLANSLRRTETRGRWGELQLRNVLEAAGLRAGIDYEEQTSVATLDGRLRPDVIVKLPDGGHIVIDAKAPLDAFLRGQDAPTEEGRQEALKNHVRLVKTHIGQLSSKEYWSQFSPSPDFVVMFLPGEAFFIAALDQEPDLIQQSVEQRVVLASPITLIALLRAVAYGWRQKRVEEKAEEIAALGATLYERLGTLAEHFSKVGDSIDRAAKSYNAAVGTLERNVLSAARRFPELGTSVKKELPMVEPVESAVRTIEQKELFRKG